MLVGSLHDPLDPTPSLRSRRMRDRWDDLSAARFGRMRRAFHA
jgi:hypothetical protein